jgi:signal transduction histidine kinase
LRSPLTAVHNAVKVLDRLGDDPATRTWVQGVLERQTAHMIRLVDDLLALYRGERDGLAVVKERTNLAAIIQRAIETVQPCLDDRAHGLKVSMPTLPVTLEADPNRLEQVLINLLGNAAKYTGPGWRIELTATVENSEVVIAVRDDGAGIDPDELPHVFEPFWRSSHALGAGGDGLGIGLALVRHFVESHGGTVSAFSAGLGRGSEFSVRLPQRG